MSHLTRKNLRLLLLTLLAIACIVALRYSGINPSPFFELGPIKIPKSTQGGVVSGTLSLICILLVFVDYKTGFKIALALNLIASGNLLFGMTMTYVTTKSINNSIVSLPGVVTNLVSIVTLVTIYFFYSKLSVSNMTDYITGQGNRRNYVKEVTEHIDARKSFTIACVELEDFKHINEIYGIQVGDILIKKTAEKLATILNKKDKLFRITGSTLAILFEPGESPEERLKSIIAPETLTITSGNGEEQIETSCTLSLGAGVVYSHPPYNYTKNASSVLRDAETALAKTRNMAENKICIFNENMENAELKQREAEFLVKDALKNNYFYLVYQPQFSTDEKNLRGFETLIRCRKPDCSIVSPISFIPAAEKTNLIMKIDDFVLRTAMTEFKPVLENSDKDLLISVNVSAKTMSSRDFASRIKNIIDEIQFPADRLEIEIIEYSFSESVENTISNIKALREMGVHIALDDFGTGYTSIKQLMTLPINLLKIDKSLIDDIETNQSMRDMVDTVIYMGHIMNCEVISEGVEKESQLDILREHKCDFIQGFVWGKPVDFEQAKDMCEQEEFGM